MPDENLIEDKKVIQNNAEIYYKPMFYIETMKFLELLGVQNGGTDIDTLSGWQIKCSSDDVISFTQVSNQGNPNNSTVRSMARSEYTFYVMGGVHNDGRIKKTQFYPPILNGANNSSIDFYFLGAGELKIASEHGVEGFYFTLANLIVGESYVNSTINNMSVTGLKIETKFPGGMNRNGGNATPSLILALPCPPFWKPGTGGIIDDYETVFDTI